MLQVAEKILEEGYIKLKVAFETVSPNVTYTALHARRKLLQMSLATLGKLFYLFSRKTFYCAL
jgi:hypothetical protein